MKLFFFIVCIFALAKTDNLVSSITVIKTDFNIEGLVSVPCDQFYNRFDKKSIDTFYISDNFQQQEILKSINSSTPTKAYQEPDTRARIFIYYKSGKIDSVCLSNTIIFSLNNNIMLLPDRNLIIMLEKLKK
jgi:hypothetical protein